MKHGIEVYEKAKERFDYNPLTGDIIYIQDTLRNKIGVIAGCDNGHGYVSVNIMESCGVWRKIMAHRLAFYIMEGYLPECIDHINGVKVDNRWCNIRACTVAENSSNLGLHPTNTSGYRGVCRHYEKWRGAVEVTGVVHRKTGFATAELANDWVVEKSKEVYGRFYNEDRI